jgi:hypothetical protein
MAVNPSGSEGRCDHSMANGPSPIGRESPPEATATGFESPFVARQMPVLRPVSAAGDPKRVPADPVMPRTARVDTAQAGY